MENVRSGNSDIHDLAKAAKMLPMYRELTSKYSLHIDLGKQCLDAFTGQGINDLASIEQILISGVDENGEKVKPGKLIDQIDQILQRPIKASEKLRLALLSTVCMGITERDRDRLVRNLTTNDMYILQSLGSLGVQLYSTSTEFKLSKDYINEMAKIVKNSTSRYAYA